MKIGTIETVEQLEDPKKRRPTLTGGGTPGGGRNGGGGDGPNNDDPGDKADTPTGQREKYRILTIFLLLVVMMTFGGLAAAYIVIATNNVAEWRPFSLPIQLWISTLIIAASSAVYFFAERAIRSGDRQRGKVYLIATTVLGAAFISSQLIAWLELSRRGLYMYGNPYVGFFYLLTAVHAVHILGGIIALGSVMLQVWQPSRDVRATRSVTSLSQVVGWYWHFMGLVWLVLFMLLGFWK